MFEEIQTKIFGRYLYCGESCWNWTRLLETRQVWQNGVWHSPGTFKKDRESKEIELAKRVANQAVNRILIVLYERLLSEHPDNRDLYLAFCHVLENNGLFEQRIEILEEMYEKFNNICDGQELSWAYGDNGDFKNAHRIRCLMAERNKEEKNA
ncbi:MAG: hypothetical protein HQL27_07370 [Candidatus Omnitrophica bacterium]|nr:hypothetical protein [Candidatus Omnitrophota bacterium]